MRYQLFAAYLLITLLGVTNSWFWPISAAIAVTPSTALAQKPRLKPKIDPRVPSGSKPGSPKRDVCWASPESQQLTAMIPFNEKNLALTASPKPVFLVYLPRGRSNVPQAQFRLLNQQNQELVTVPVNIGQKSGVLALKLPETLFSLAIDQFYRWEFTVICQPGDRTKDVTVGALIQRVSPDPALTQQLQTATPEQKLDLYASAGLWHDLIALLLENRLSKPQDMKLKASWTNYLKQTDLGNLASEPIAGIITLRR